MIRLDRRMLLGGAVLGVGAAIGLAGCPAPETPVRIDGQVERERCRARTGGDVHGLADRVHMRLPIVVQVREPCATACQ